MHGCRLCGAIVVLCLLSGCEVGRTMFQMDSNSGQPFFGVDLLRSKSAHMARPVSPGSTAVVTQVRDLPKNSSAMVATVAATKANEPSLLERLKLKRPERVSLSLSEADAEAVEGPVEEFR